MEFVESQTCADRRMYCMFGNVSVGSVETPSNHGFLAAVDSLNSNIDFGQKALLKIRHLAKLEKEESKWNLVYYSVDICVRKDPFFFLSTSHRKQLNLQSADTSKSHKNTPKSPTLLRNDEEY